MTSKSKVTQGHRNCLYSTRHIILLHVAPFPRYYHIYSVGYMTACDLEKSIFETVEITSNVRFPIHV